MYKRQSYASEDTDLLGVDEDYTALENELAQTVANIESTHPVSYTHLDVYKRQPPFSPQRPKNAASRTRAISAMRRTHRQA